MSCYKHVAGIAKFAPGIDIAAAGGLMMPENVVEVMMLGAKIAAHCTGMLYHGRNLLRRDIAWSVCGNLSKSSQEPENAGLSLFLGNRRNHVPDGKIPDIYLASLKVNPEFSYIAPARF